MTTSPQSDKADHILQLAGADTWTRARVRAKLSQSVEKQELLLQKLAVAQAAAQRIQAAADASRERGEQLSTDHATKHPHAVQNRWALVKQIAHSSRKAAEEIAQVFEQFDQLDNKSAWTAVCASAVEESVVRVVRSTFAARRHSIEEGFWQELSGALAGAAELFNIVGDDDRLLPRTLESPRRMSVTESMHGLGVLEALSRNWGVDHIVTINSGGAIVGDYIGQRLSLENNQLHHVTYKNHTLSKNIAKLAFGRGKKRVLIVDDISRTGRTLREVHAALSETFSRVHFQCVSLVSAVKPILGVNTLYGYATAVTEDPSVTVPWTTKGKFRVRRGRYVLGQPEESFEIIEAQADAIQRELAR